jgi:hypothetical protein
VPLPESRRQPVIGFQLLHQLPVTIVNALHILPLPVIAS